MQQEQQDQAKSHMRRREENPQPETSQETGGREFGQVIEPMQGQMASGNEGLTDKTAGQNSSQDTGSKKNAA